jgi:DNA-binding winged helix-turn-helix (wHTH) protein
MEILIALVERPGELLSKRRLMEMVWPDTIVVEGNLPVHVAALRRALGDGQGENRYIINIPGRGYRFVAPIKSANAAHPASSSIVYLECPPSFVHRATRLVGRADVIRNVVKQQLNNRMLTIVGPSGIGKTALALNVAEELIVEFQDGARLVDLSSITDPALVTAAVATALNLDMDATKSLYGPLRALTGKSMLLVLDHCEHLVDQIAALATTILKTTPGISILATSREPLSVSGERIYRLQTLAVPPKLDALSAAEALSYPAVQLFAERAASIMNDFELDDADAADVADVCRRLDGLPLAIEFAAARVAALPVSQIALRLDDLLGLLASGERANPLLQRTIASGVDWSCERPDEGSTCLAHAGLPAGQVRTCGGHCQHGVAAVLPSNGVVRPAAGDMLGGGCEASSAVRSPMYCAGAKPALRDGGYIGDMLWGRIGMRASTVAVADSAGAADLAVKAVPAAPVYLADWTGFYIGVNGGGGWGNNKSDSFPVDNAKPSGALVGGHAGYNWESGSFVGGLEVDFDGADISEPFTPIPGGSLKDKTAVLATAHARLGRVVLPNLLAYGTAGTACNLTALTAMNASLQAKEVSRMGWQFLAQPSRRMKLADQAARPTS